MQNVSIIIPTFNRSSLVERAIHSALHQTYPFIDVVVVDDGSTDDTREVVATFGARVRYAYQPNAGVCAARNTGATLATGEYLLFLDSDDTLLPSGVEQLVAALDANSSAGMAFGQATMTDADGTARTVRKPPFDRPAGTVRQERELEHLVLHNYVTTSAALVRRSVWDEVGGFDSARGNIGEDWDLWVRIACRTALAYVPAPIVTYTMHAGSLSNIVSAETRATWLRNHEHILTTVLGHPTLGTRVAANINRYTGHHHFHAARLAYVAHDHATARSELAQAIHLYPALLLDREAEGARVLWLKLKMPHGLVESLRAAKHARSAE